MAFIFDQTDRLGFCAAFRPVEGAVSQTRARFGVKNPRTHRTWLAIGY